jgi:hypothetical protein
MFVCDYRETSRKQQDDVDCDVQAVQERGGAIYEESRHAGLPPPANLLMAFAFRCPSLAHLPTI